MRRVYRHTMTKYDRCVALHSLVEARRGGGDPGRAGRVRRLRGGSAALMALANGRYGKTRRALHLFDAWGDWPDPTEKDGNRFDDLKRGELLKADNDGALAACKELMHDVVRHPDDLVHYHRDSSTGRCPRRAMRSARSPCCASTATGTDPIKLCLEQLWPLVAPGGVVLFDDYGYCDGARRATDEFLAATGRRHLPPLSSTTRAATS
jgi:hypothetical protein